MRSRVLTGWLFVAVAAAAQDSPFEAAVDASLALPTGIAPASGAGLKAPVE